MAEGAMFYAIRLPDGKWWRKGSGQRKPGPVSKFRDASQYGNKGSAVSVAVRQAMDEVFGGFEIVETPRVVGTVVATTFSYPHK